MEKIKMTFVKPSLVAFLFFVLAGCVSQQKITETTPAPATTLTILHQSNRWGSLDPCGCSVNPYGGLDREKNAIDAIRKVEGSTLFADAGNMFVRKPLVAPVSHYQARAKAVTEMLNLMGLEIYAPGPNDYELGLPFLKSLEKDSKFKYVSTNVIDASGKTAFQPFQVIVKDGVRYGFVSITPTTETLPAPLKAVEPEKALNEWLPKVHAASDVVVLLSQLDSTSAQHLADKDFGIPVIIGADSGLSSNEPFIFNHGKTIYVDTHVNGNLLGRLYLKLQLPFTDFKAGHSTFNHELTKLDKQRFGTPNEITKLIEKEKERTRKAALSE